MVPTTLAFTARILSSVILALLVPAEGSGQAPATTFEVSLENGRAFRADDAQRVGDTWVFRFEAGRLELAASTVREVRAAGSDAPNSPPPANQISPLRTAEERGRREQLAVGDRRLSVEIPKRFGAPHSHDRIVTLTTEDGSESLRFAESEVKSSLWTLRGGVQQLHAARYEGFQVRSEDFTLLGPHPSWLLTFSYRKGDETWIECQGFLVVEGKLVVISATALPVSTPPRNLIRSLGRSLRLGGTDSKP